MDETKPLKTLTPEAKRALSEAQERRAAAARRAEQEERQAKDQKTEVGGPDGLEPTRYGDWERKGLASDF